MSWLEWTLLGISIYGCGYTWRVLFRDFISDYLSPDWEDVIVNSILAFLWCFLWPFLLIKWSFKNTIGKGDPEVFARRLAGEGRKEKMERRMRQRELELREREDRVRHMERELGLEES